MQCQADLVKFVRTLIPLRGGANFLNGRKEQPKKNG
jgi:hypothetical protein